MTHANDTLGSEAGEWGYLLVHFREGQGGEQIHLSLSDGDDPLSWTPLQGGRPVLRSDLGTRGVRDPVIVRDRFGMFHILATDLHVETGSEPDWEEWVRTGSRSLVIWDSPNLIDWSSPRLVEVSPPTAGMTWAPEVCLDPDTGDHLVYWSSRLYPLDDPTHRGDSYSRILCCKTTDFHDFTPAEVLFDTGYDMIDTTIAVHAGRFHRIGKDEDRGASSLGVHHEVSGSLRGDEYLLVDSRIGARRYPNVEGPILVRSHLGGRWYLFLDQYSQTPQGYVAFETDDLDAGAWREVDDRAFHLAPGTKHGGILDLTRTEWERLARLR